MNKLKSLDTPLSQWTLPPFCYSQLTLPPLCYSQWTLSPLSLSLDTPSPLSQSLDIPFPLLQSMNTLSSVTVTSPLPQLTDTSAQLMSAPSLH